MGTSSNVLVMTAILMTSMVAGPCTARDITMGVIVPEDRPMAPSQLVVSAVQLAQEMAQTRLGLLDGHHVRSSFMGQVSEMAAQMEEAHERGELDVLMGDVDAVAGLGREWNIPVMTLGLEPYNTTIEGLPSAIRAGPVDPVSMADFFVRVMGFYGWTRIKLIFQNPGGDDFVSRNCPSAMRVLGSRLLEEGIDTVLLEAPEQTFPPSFFGPVLGRQYSIVALCGTPHFVRELMIQAHDLHLDNGDHVFLNIDLFSREPRPWYSESDTRERNEKAASGFQAVQTISLKKPSSLQYMRFSSEVKRRAMIMFGDSGFETGPVSPYVGYFHDAVLLYLMAVNQTLEAGYPISDGGRVINFMRNMNFQGITGTVTMDPDGRRVVDYSLSAMNPHTRMFEVVANYYGNRRQMEPVIGRRISWGGGRNAPPPDQISS